MCIRDRYSQVDAETYNPAVDAEREQISTKPCLDRHSQLFKHDFSHLLLESQSVSEPYNVNDHRAAAIDLQAEKAARPAAPCASYCYHAIIEDQALPSAIHSTDVPVGHHQVCETTLLVWRLGAKPLVRTRYLTRIVDTEIWV